jgi:hypothetical protein
VTPFVPPPRIPGESTQDYKARITPLVSQHLRTAAAESPPSAPSLSPPLPPTRAELRGAGQSLEEQQAAATAKARAKEAADRRLEERDRRKLPTVGAALPASTQAAAGLRVERVRILKNDVPESLPRKTPKAAFMAHVRKVVKGLRGRGVSERCLEDVAEGYFYFEDKRGGFAQVGLNGFAAVVRYCARHIQRAWRLLEGGGLFDVMNVPYREGDEWWRDANIYVATMDEEPPPLPADVEGPDPAVPASASRALGGASRLAALFGLALRAGGLNKFPASNYRTRPAPA